MLAQNDGDEHDEPVAHECQEVLQDQEEVVLPRHSADEIDQHDDADPEVARDSLSVATQHLCAQCSSVGAEDVVGYDAQRNEYGAKFPKSAHWAVSLQNQRPRGDSIRGFPIRICGNTGTEADTDDIDKKEGGPEAHKCHQEDELLRCVLGVVDKIVGSGAGPGHGYGQLQREKREPVGGYRGGRAGGLGGDVEVFAGDTAEDEEDNHLRYPRPSGWGFQY